MLAAPRYELDPINSQKNVFHTVKQITNDLFWIKGLTRYHGPQKNLLCRIWSGLENRLHGEASARQGCVGGMGNGQDGVRDLSMATRKECGYSMAGHSFHRHWGASRQVGAILNQIKFQERVNAIKSFLQPSFSFSNRVLKTQNSACGLHWFLS